MDDLSNTTVAILGMGQMGGSIGLKLVSSGAVRKVIGVVRREDAVGEATGAKAAHEATMVLESALGDADVVLLAVPVKRILEFIPTVARCIRKETLVLDVGSTKAAIVKAAEDDFEPGQFVGGHPMAGNEGAGLPSASADLLEGAPFILVETRGLEAGNKGKAEALVTALGAHVHWLDPDQHDSLLALISHLPHVIAYALIGMSLAEDEDQELVRTLAAGSYRGATRVAASDPEMVLDMLLTNREALTQRIDEFSRRMNRLRAVLEEGHREDLVSFLSDMQDFRKRLDC